MNRKKKIINDIISDWGFWLLLSILIVLLTFAILYALDSFLAKSNDNFNSNIATPPSSSSPSAVSQPPTNVASPSQVASPPPASPSPSILSFLFPPSAKNSNSPEEVAVPSQPPLFPAVNEHINYFGDSFSGDAYLNLPETDFFLDFNVTALMFSPVYELNKIYPGSSVPSLIESARKKIDKNNVCLSGGCLTLDNKQLFFNQKLLNLPAELSDLKREGNIVTMSIGGLDTKWLIGVVVGKEYDEYALVYYFDGKSFQALISKNTDAKINPKYERLGGTIGFGGSDNDFLIIYGGYNGVAYRVRGQSGQEKFTDISKFFGLRVTAGGFIPQVVNVGTGSDKSWFVCGWNGKSMKMVKLWQNNSGEIVGAIDFGGFIFDSARSSLSSLEMKSEFINNNFVCLPNNKKGVSFVFFPKIAGSNSGNFNESNNPVSIWEFSDYGFNNSHDYKALSANLNTTGQKISRAIIKEFSFAGNFQLFMSNNNSNWLETSVGKWLYFPDENNNGLYWRLLATKGNSDYYSPFFDNVNALEYYFIK